MNNKRIFLSSPTVNGFEIEYIEDAIRKNWIAPLGENVDEFENEIQRYVHCENALALSSGTAAIHLALKLAGVDKGDMVFCPSLTFSASVNPIIYQNAVPVLIDCEEDNLNMSPCALRKAFEKYGRPKAVIAVHMYGTPARMNEILEICNEYDTPVIEDSAEALGARLDGKYMGTFGKSGIYSFNGNKIITTSGGGILVTKTAEEKQKAKFWATQSRDAAPWYQHSELGYNYRMSNIVAGIGRGQLRTLDKYIALKKKIYDTYKEQLSDIDEIRLNGYAKNSEPNFWLSCLITDAKSKITPSMIVSALENENIESRYIWKPMHIQPYFECYEYVKSDNRSVSDEIFNHGICLPSDIKNTDEDMDRIISVIRKVFGK